MKDTSTLTLEDKAQVDEVPLREIGKITPTSFRILPELNSASAAEAASHTERTQVGNAKAEKYEDIFSVSD